MLFGAFREELTRIEKDFAKEYPSRKSTLEDVMVEIRGRLDLLERDVLETLGKKSEVLQWVAAAQKETGRWRYVARGG